MIRPASVLLVIAAAWTVLVAAAPVLGWPFVYTAAHRVCHQIPPRSFHIAGAPMAVCARCFGLYLGGVAAGGVALVRTRRRPATEARRARWLIAAAALPTVITLFAEWILRWPVGNAARFVAALPLGATAAWLVVRALEVDWQA
jgi:uncharacterized membrane protein